MKLTLAPYYGGKNKWLGLILPLLNVPHNHFIEPCFGMGSVFFNKPPARLSTINDLDDNIINLLEVIRNKKDELQRALRLTPWSKSELKNSLCDLKNLDPVEWARLFYVRLYQGFNSTPRANGNGWKHSIKADLQKGTNCPAMWINAVERLDLIAQRLLMAQIENDNIFNLVPAYDRPDNLFYIDPPYDFDARHRNTHQYNHEMDANDQKQLLLMLNECKSKVAISGYRTKLYDDLLDGWVRIDSKSTKLSSSKERKTEKIESVWLNYSPPAEQLSFFGGGL